MTIFRLAGAATFCIGMACSLGAQPKPLQLHPENSHYFEFRGRPAVLVTSGEHYGAVLNPAFDYVTYLDVLAAQGFNLTRVFAGSFCEAARKGADSRRTSLMPLPDQHLAPWARSSTAGAPETGNRFDLDQWDPAYFTRLKDYVREAGKRGIVVEIVLFSAIYRPQFWELSPLNAASNINGVGGIPMTEFHSLQHADLVARQDAMVEKIVGELRSFDNVYYEICNEPYWSQGIPDVDPTIKGQHWTPQTMAWQDHIADTIARTEAAEPHQHLVAVNVANNYLKVEKVHPAVSILNFHYAWPPKAVPDNYGLKRPVAFDETSDGDNAPNRRREAWAFLFSGGAVYSNLDFSFTPDDPTGLGRNPKGRRQSGAEVRQQLSVLLKLVNGLDYVHMHPLPGEAIEGLPAAVRAYGLGRDDGTAAIYFVKEDTVQAETARMTLPRGGYDFRWIDPLDGRAMKSSNLKHPGGPLSLALPQFRDDLALLIRRK